MLGVQKIDGSQFGKAARNEMRKIRAAYLNGVALALLAVGYLTPFFGLYLHEGAITGAQGLGILAVLAVSSLGTMILHRGAMDAVSRIED